MTATSNRPKRRQWADKNQDRCLIAPAVKGTTVKQSAARNQRKRPGRGFVHRRGRVSERLDHHQHHSHQRPARRSLNQRTNISRLLPAMSWQQHYGGGEITSTTRTARASAIMPPADAIASHSHRPSAATGTASSVVKRNGLRAISTSGRARHRPGANRQITDARQMKGRQGQLATKTIGLDPEHARSLRACARGRGQPHQPGTSAVPFCSATAARARAPRADEATQGHIPPCLSAPPAPQPPAACAVTTPATGARARRHARPSLSRVQHETGPARGQRPCPMDRLSLICCCRWPKTA